MTEVRIPLWLTDLFETIGARLTKVDRKTFDKAWQEALQPTPSDFDLERVYVPFITLLLRREIRRVQGDDWRAAADLNAIVNWLQEGKPDESWQKVQRIAEAVVLAGMVLREQIVTAADYAMQIGGHTEPVAQAQDLYRLLSLCRPDSTTLSEAAMKKPGHGRCGGPALCGICQADLEVLRAIPRMQQFGAIGG